MHQRALDWLSARLPRWTYASDDLRSSWLAPRAEAIHQRYVGLNSRRAVHCVTVDCDHDDTYRWRHAALPTPLCVAVTPKTGRHHVTWELRESVTRSDAARLRPLAYLARIEAGLVDALDGDKSYVGLLTKNPAHTDWHTEWWAGQPVGLDDLAERVSLELWEPKRRAVSDYASLGRNCALFEELRQWAYEMKAQHISIDAFRAAVHQQAEDINRAFPSPLPASEIKATAKSVAAWTWRHYTGAGHDRRHWRVGLLNLSPTVPRRERQSMGARHTHTLRSERTLASLLSARQTLLDCGMRVSQSEVARESGVSLRQVKRLWADLNRAPCAASLPVQGGSARTNLPSGVRLSDGAYGTSG